MPFCTACGADLGETGPRYCPQCGARCDFSGVDDGPAGTGPAPDSNFQTGVEASPTEQASADHDAESEGDLAGRTLLNGAIGGFVGLIVGLMFGTVFGPLYVLGIGIGGFLAGYFHDRGPGSGALVGGFAGILATIPFVALLLLAFAGFGMLAAADMPATSPVEMGTIFGMMALVASIAIALLNAIFGLVGGLFGGAVADS